MARMHNQYNPYIPEKFRITKVFCETRDTATFRLECSMDHMPGQFVEVTVPGIGECPISFSSYSGKHIDLCIRNVGNVTRAIHAKKQGDFLWVRGPYGHGYPMQEMHGQDIMLIGGGTGVAPLRGALEYLSSNRKDFGKVSLYLGFRQPYDMLFKRDYNEWKRKFSLNLTVDKPEPGWKGNVGVVTTLLDKAEINKDSAAIICGPPIMIKFIMQSLMAKGIKEEKVYISFERLMSCGIGKCGHCELSGKYVCRHGPVFRYDHTKSMVD